METGFLKPLFDRPGPWASVYIDTSRTTEDAARQQKLRERAVASQLIDEGADAYTCRAVMDRLAHEDVSGTPPGRALFATGAEVVLDLPLAVSPQTEAFWSMLPHVAPLAGLHVDEPTCLVAYIDSTGADLELWESYRREPLGQAQRREWQGRGHRSIPADRYEWHYQNKVENGLNQTADIVAAELDRRWPEAGAQLLVLAGESRERRAVRNRLPEPIRAVTVEAENGSRSPGASKSRLSEQVVQAREKYAREQLEDAVSRFRTGRGRPGEHRTAGVDTGPGQAAEGAPAVVEAARGRQVATLLLGEDGPDTGREVWIGPSPEQVAVQRSEARAMGVAQPERARADDALIRAAAAADADVLLVPGDVAAGPVGGLGAVLRWVV
ncbi:hypothetical protein [Streptomyces gobiensis]|uniref:baeRF2 domain-containing protein n=1 Tax=Streptomyces gobiensis TaxID=2875706 RepID=UPI001E2D86B1|nr:hypothetical protein [Streptomyces gobiensis]UGY91888.1 hypothetical protein test1122_09250 [Streptomyces gobiensis]